MRTLTLISIITFTAFAWAADVEIPTFARPAVTVIPFEDKSPQTGTEVPPVPGMAFDPEAPMPWLADGLPGMLELAFERSGALNVIPRTEFAFALNKRRDAELAVDTPFAVIDDVAKREGATHAVGGSFVKEGKSLSFTVTVWEIGADLEAVPQDEAELERLRAEMERVGAELAKIMTDAALTPEEKEARVAEVKAELDELTARITEAATARVNAAVLEKIAALGDELSAVLADPALSPEEKETRAAEIEAAMEEFSARLIEGGAAAPAGQSKEFSGKVEDVFSLADAAAAFVLTATGAGGGTGLIRRQPTSDLEAFRWFAKGAGRYYTGEQISFFSSATQKDDNFAEAHLMLGKAYLKEKVYPTAKAAFEKSRALADYYPSAPTGLATITRKEEPENAEAATYLFNEALAIDPSYAPVFDGRGGMYFAVGDYQAAREAYEQFIAIWPTNKDGYYALGNTLWLLGKDSPQWKSLLRSAIDSYEKSLAVDPDFAACHYNLASVFKIFEDVENAIFHYRRYIELEPDSPKRAEIEETIADWEAKYGPK
jgi:tetratricopeptide (TPR) repeat protein